MGVAVATGEQKTALTLIISFDGGHGGRGGCGCRSDHGGRAGRVVVVVRPHVVVVVLAGAAVVNCHQ